MVYLILMSQGLNLRLKYTQQRVRAECPYYAGIHVIEVEIYQIIEVPSVHTVRINKNLCVSLRCL